MVFDNNNKKSIICLNFYNIISSLINIDFYFLYILQILKFTSDGGCLLIEIIKFTRTYQLKIFELISDFS